MQKKQSVTDRRTDRQTDRPTDRLTDTVTYRSRVRAKNWSEINAIGVAVEELVQ